MKIYQIQKLTSTYPLIKKLFKIAVFFKWLLSLAISSQILEKVSNLLSTDFVSAPLSGFFTSTSSSELCEELVFLLIGFFLVSSSSLAISVSESCLVIALAIPDFLGLSGELDGLDVFDLELRFSSFSSNILSI